MSTDTRISKRTSLSELCAKNSGLRVQREAMYNLLVKCRDWLRIMGAHPEKIDELDGMIRRVQKNPL